jgi:maltooligosyltrehalose trehalohydrolase
MGEEFGASTPFLFFCDFDADLAAAVTRGRREEFKRFARFRDPAARERIPDPNDPATFERSKLRWGELDQEEHRRWHARYRELLELRRKHLAPRLAGMASGGSFTAAGSVLQIEWTLGDRSRLRLAANLGPAASPPVLLPAGTPIYASAPIASGPRASLAPWSVLVAREGPDG